MLVKKSIVENWYQHNSWVYKNFALLFQNSMWNKKIPSGFSVCPYFWMSMFSLIILQPFVLFPFNYLIKPIFSLMGNRAIAVDNLCCNLLSRYGNLPLIQTETRPVGLASAMTALIVFFSMFLPWALFKFTVSMYEIYLANLGNTFDETMFCSFSSFMALVFGIGIHGIFSSSDCKIFNYIYVWLTGFVVVAFVKIPSEVYYSAKTIIDNILAVTIMLCGAITTGAEVVAVFAWDVLKIVFMWSPSGNIFFPWWAYIITLSLVGLIILKSSSYIDGKYGGSFKTNLSKKEQENINRDNWVNLMVSAICTRSSFKNGHSYIGNEYEYKANIARIHHKEIYRRIFKDLFKSRLNKLKHTEAPAFKNISKELTRNYLFFDYRFESVFGVPFEEYDFLTRMVKICKRKDIKKMMDATNELYVSNEKERLRRQEELKKTTTYKLCHQVTNRIGICVYKIGNVGLSGFNQAKTLFAYLWMLIKAKKQGACPFFRFTDSDKAEKK